MSKYLGVLLLSLSLPLVLSFWPSLKFWRRPFALFVSIFIIVIEFGAWDCFATMRRHWSFNPEGVSGFTIINLPYEEWLFFIVIPFCCIFTWEVVKFFKEKLR